MTIVGLIVGGALGAAARYGALLAVSSRRRGPLPFGTLVVNVTGSLLLGVVVGLVVSDRLADFWITWAATGFLGAFTTFSTFTFETAQLVGEHGLPRAGANVLFTTGLSIGAAAMGYFVVA